MLRPLSVWLNPKADVSWKPSEVSLAFPRIWFILPSLLSAYKLHLGPIISFFLFAEMKTNMALK